MTDCSDVSFQPLSALREFEPTTAKSNTEKTGTQQQVKYTPALYIQSRGEKKVDIQQWLI